MNLPPDELRRLSAMAAARDDGRSSMDIEPDAPSSPALSVNPSQIPPTPGTPEANGIHPEESERSPTPPPHTVSPNPPQPARLPVDAEAFKLAGNKFFKTGDYQKAIEEYTKG